jgi:hypothetical protein
MIENRNNPEKELKRLKLSAMPPGLKERILHEASTFTFPHISLTDKIWASQSLRISWVSVVLILTLAALFSDWKVERTTVRGLQGKPPSFAAEHDLIARELELDESELLPFIHYRSGNRAATLNGTNRYHRQDKLLMEL